MAAFSSKGTSIYLTKGSATALSLVPTAITNAAPAVVTVADTTGLTDGDLAKVSGTGTALDGQVFTVDNVTATTFELVGSDLSGLAGAPTLPGAGEKVEAYGATDMVKLCLSSITINNSEPGVISTATFCAPQSSVPSATQEAPTLTITGYVDESAADYKELLLAAKDGKQRVIEVRFPDPHGSLVAAVTLSSMGYEVPIDGAPGYTMTGVLTGPFEHRA